MKKTARVLFAFCFLIVSAIPLAIKAVQPPPETEIVLWEDHFLGGTPGTRPDNWFDDTATLRYHTTDSLANLTLISAQGWGGANSIHMPVDLNLYPKLCVNINAMQNCQVVVQLFRYPSMVLLPDPSVHAEVRLWVAGNYIFDIPTLTGDSGVQDYGIRLTVEGAQGAVAVIDQVKIYGMTTATPTPTPSMTPTITPTVTVLDETWTLIGQGFGNQTSPINSASLALYQGQLCLGTTESTTARARFYNGSTWSSVQSVGDGARIALSETNGNLYAGYAQQVSQYNGTAWNHLGGSYSYYPFYDLTAQGSDIYSVWGDLNNIYVSRLVGDTFVLMDEGINAFHSMAVPPHAQIACTSSGIPYVTYEEYANGVDQVFVKHWNGEFWQGESSGCLNINSGHFANQPSIAAYGEQIYIAWHETVDANYSGLQQVHVKHWNGSSWQVLGAPLNNFSTGSAEWVEMAVDRLGVPYVAFVESGKLYVKHWNGTIWVQDGISQNISSDATASIPALVISETTIYLAWQETVGSNYVINVKSLALAVPANTATSTVSATITQTATITPTATVTPTVTATPTPISWTLIGQGLDQGLNISQTSLTLYQAQPMVGWLNTGNSRNASTRVYTGSQWLDAQTFTETGYPAFQLTENSGNQYACVSNYPPSVREYASLYNFNGTAWSSLGDIAPVGGAGGDGNFAMSVTAYGSNVYMAWHALTWPDRNYWQHNLYVSRWNGSAFEQMHEGINTNKIDSPLTARLACTGTGMPYIAFSEKTNGQYQVNAKRWVSGMWHNYGILNINSSNYAFNPQIAAYQEEVYIAWNESIDTTSTGQKKVYVKRWTGSGWLSLGGSLNVSPTGNCTDQSLAVSPTGVPYVILVEDGQVYVKHWNGSEWIQDGNALNVNIAEIASLPAIAISDTNIYTAWKEMTGSVGSLNVKSLAISGGGGQGAAMALHCPNTKTATPTVTCTPTPKNTMTQFTMTATPTATVTSTPTPWLSAKEVIAYPNPARGRVMFSYTVSGEITVTLDLYKINGERVAHISETRDGGMGQTLTTIWEAAGVSPGVYLSRLQIKDAQGQVVLDQKRKVALIK